MTKRYSFISDLDFRYILERDHAELDACLACKAHKSVLVLSGSIIEAILVEYYLNNLPPTTTATDILKKDLFNLLTMASNDGLISKRIFDLSTVIRGFRNLIHPGREIREQEKFDEDSAIVASSLLNMFITEVEKNYYKIHSYTSEDIIRKLQTDNYTYTIFSQLLDKINYAEKGKLLNFLTDYEMVYIRNIEEIGEAAIEIQNVDYYLSKLIPTVHNKDILKQLNKLVKYVEMGEPREVMSLYKHYHNHLEYLSDSNIELVLTYILRQLSFIKGKNAHLKYHLDQGTFRTLGKYITKRDSEMLNLFIIVLREYAYLYNEKKQESLLNFFYSIWNNFNEDCKNYMKESEDIIWIDLLSNKFIDEMQSYNDLPF